MRIQHNISALNTYRQMATNNTGASKALEKLSSGYKINRAGDDAAGLAISEKMRAQINGLNRASSNAQDGVSLIQAAEGALQETHSILQRMRELSVQAANDTNATADRGAIQAELNQLSKEVDRIAHTTEFNKKTLLDGSLSSGKVAKTSSQLTNIDIASTVTNGDYSIVVEDIGAKATVEIEKFAFSTNGTKVGTAGTVTLNNLLDDGKGGLGNFSIDIAVGLDENGIAQEIVNKINLETKSKYTAKFDAGAITLTAKEEGDVTGNEVSMTIAGIQDDDGEDVSAATIDATDVGVDGTFEDFSYDSNTKTFTGTGATMTGISFQLNGTSPMPTTGGTYNINVDDGKELTLQVGANSGSNQTINISVEALTSKGLGINNLNVKDHISSQQAVDSIEIAITKVSDQRSALGAIQNRLEHTVANLDTVAENMQAAESRIRDVDMAKEMMNFTKFNILMQASQAMMAQANAQPQGVLQLLR